MRKIAVVSSVYGDYDAPISPVPQTTPCDFVLVTDRHHEDLKGWRQVIESRPQLHPRLAAKVAKCRPDLYADADIYIWVDTSIFICHQELVTWAASYAEYGRIAQLVHPHRVSLMAEARLSAGLPKYRDLPVFEQIAYYLARGYPDDWGLWATGLIVYRGGDWLHEFGARWLQDQLRWTYQDQLSEPPLLWKMQLRPVDMHGPLVGHPYFELRQHSDGT